MTPDDDDHARVGIRELEHYAPKLAIAPFAKLPAAILRSAARGADKSRLADKRPAQKRARVTLPKIEIGKGDKA